MATISARRRPGDLIGGLWARLSRGSMCFGRSDPSLERDDRLIRRKEAKGTPEDLRRLATSTELTHPDGRALALIYAAVASWYRLEWDAAMADLRAAISATQAPPLQARALQILVYLLFMSCDEARGDERMIEADAHEKECRDLCERGHKDFAGFEWSASVVGVLETALGVMDHPKDRFTSMLHLVRALQTEDRARRDMHQFCPGCIGFAYLYMGHHRLHDGAPVAAAEHYEAAVRELSGDLRVHASIHLLEALSQTGAFTRVKRAARKVLRKIPPAARGGFQAVEVKRYLAQACIRTGEAAEAERILREIVAAPGDQPWKRSARQWLEARRSARSSRS